MPAGDPPWWISQVQVHQEVQRAFYKNTIAQARADALEEAATLVENYALQYAEPVWALKLTAMIRELKEMK
jgi:hypothetical protein